jgi:carbamoyltransferase
VARVLGLNAVFHDPAAAVVVDGRTVAAAEEERFTRRKHGKQAVPFSTWELPEQSMRWCLEQAGLTAGDLDAVAYSYDPALGERPGEDLSVHEWEGLRTLYAQRAPHFLRSVLGDEAADVAFHHVPHHVAHAASAYLAGPHDRCAVLVLDGRGERASGLAGHAVGGELEVLATQPLPHSLGLLYEEVTEHVGFLRSSDEYKVMALASYGEPRHLELFRQAVRTDGEGGFRTDPIDLASLAAPRRPSQPLGRDHADLASSLQVRLEEVVLELAAWLADATGERALVMAGGVALNCVANARLAREGPFESVWVQPAAGDAGTALGAALHTAHVLGDAVEPVPGAALGRGWSDDELGAVLRTAAVAHHRPASRAALCAEVADALAADCVVGWFEGRSEFGPRALGHRSLLADPRHERNLERLNDIKGREQFRPVAPMVLLERAAEIFDGPLPSPYMLFVHQVRPAWRARIPAVTHVDGTARAQTVDEREEPVMAELLRAVEARTGVPVLVNTSFNTAGRPMVDHPHDALEVFGSSPLDVLVLGPYVVRRPGRAA